MSTEQKVKKPHKSGFCCVGLHEGDNPKNFAGKSLPTCTFSSEQCSCECHIKFDQLYAMSEQDRITVNFSTYKPDKGEFVMPDLDALARERAINRAEVVVEESPAPELVPAVLKRTFAETPTGRSAKGELEQWVDEVCRDWVIEKEGNLCTPKYIAAEIAKRQGIKLPSEGAIGAAFDRWTGLGYATIERKPLRFVGYTDEGLKLGLAACKEKARRERRGPK